jgi:hypothetical protein
MIRDRAVLILGAGASASYGFPLGPKLVRNIVDGTGGPGYELFRLLAACEHPSQHIHDFHYAIVNARPKTIDVFLRSRPEFRRLGKEAIAASLIPHELPNTLVAPVDPDDDWYHYLFECLHGDTTNDFLSNLFSVITFNFDRSFERALFTSVRHRYPISDEQAIEIVRKIPIVHVHGSLGGCTWLGDSNVPRDYESPGALTSELVTKVAEGLRIIGDEVEGRNAEIAQKLLSGASVVYFLGLGYHRMNLQWLFDQGLLGHRGVDIRGTAYGLAPGEHRFAVEKIPDFSIGDYQMKTMEFLRHQPLLHG